MGFQIKIRGTTSKAQHNVVFSRGSAFKGTRSSDLVCLQEYFSSVQSIDDFKARVESLNGYFCVICKQDNTLYAAVDRARSIPLFYGCTNDEFYISDDACWIREKVNSVKRSEIAEQEFCMTGYVTNSDTLYPGVKQLRAGELLIATLQCGSPSSRVDRYYDFINAGEYYPPDARELARQFDQVLMRSFERLLAFANGRTIAIPLSGGWDSRLVALMLTRLGYNNVIAFTYGRPGNLESEISRRVANALNIEWHFVPYTNELRNRWFWTDERTSYYSMAHNLVSLPHSQDWPAVWELKKKGLIPATCVIVPGHTGDFLAGTTGIPKSFLTAGVIPSARIVDEIYNGHYSLRQLGKDALHIEETMKQRILSQLGVYENLSPEDAVAFYKRWVWQERQAKFIVNSVRVYEFWGYDWWIPLGDYEMRDFWTRVPIELRFDKRLYITHIKHLADQIVGAGSIDFHRTERDALVNQLKKGLRLVPLRGLVTKAGRRLKRETVYENDPLASYGIMSKETFLKYYDMGFRNINAYAAAYTIGLIDLP